MRRSQPYCRIELKDHTMTYTVYDQWGLIMAHTTSRSVAQQFLALANKGISARVYYWLERWNWRVPRRLINR